MEHIVQFAIGIDDEAIVKRVEENAEKVIINELQAQIKKTIFDKDYFGRPTETLSTWAESHLDGFLEKHKTEIIECAGKYLAERLARTKAAKEVLEGVKNE